MKNTKSLKNDDQQDNYIEYLHYLLNEKLEIYETFDSMNLDKKLLQGIYA